MAISCLPAAQRPTIAGFTAWIRIVMGVSASILPDGAPIIGYAYETALAVTNHWLANMPGLIYKYAVYNLGGDNLVNFAPDPPANVPPNSPTFWADLRKGFGINNFTAGVVSASSDNGTSSNLEVIEGAKNFTLEDLQHLKTPWGRQYTAWAMQYGTLWGLS